MIKQTAVCAIDIGDSAIIASLAVINRNGKIESLQTEEIVSRGFDNGIINDVSSLSDSIHEAMQALKDKTKTKINEAIVNISGNNIICRNSSATIPLLEKGSKLISKSDIVKVNKQARLLGLNLEEEILHEFIQNYSIDNYGEVKNPLGLYGRKISVKLYLIVCKADYISNLVSALNQAGLEVKRLAFSGYASSLAVLTKEETQNGCVLVSIGKNISELLFFKDGSLRLVDILPLGGNIITENIASKLKLSWELAEELKISYVSALEDDIKGDEEILIKKVSTYRPVKRKVIVEGCKDVIYKFVDNIKAKIDDSSLREQMESGVIITGGGSLLHGLLELIESRVGLPTRLGKVRNISLPSSKNPQYSTAIGLIYYYIDKIFSKKDPIQKSNNIFDNIVEKVKNLYQEYF